MPDFKSALSLVPRTSKREAACFYASLGLSVLPINPQSKTPAVKFADRHLSPEEVAAHWESYPNHNIALRCTALFCVDIDRKNGVDGLESLRPFWDYLPPTLKAVTPSGGFHLIYAKPETAGGFLDLFPEAGKPFAQKIGMLAGVDLKFGKNTYFLVSPSDKGERRYAFANDLPVAVAPYVLYGFLREHSAPPVAPALPPRQIRLPDSEKTFEISPSWIEEMAPGGRNATLYKFVRFYLDPFRRHGGYCVDIVLEKARELNEISGDPLPEREFNNTFHSAFTAYRKEAGLIGHIEH